MMERVRALIEQTMLAAQCINQGSAEAQHEQRVGVWQEAIQTIIERCLDLAEDAVLDVEDSHSGEIICDGIRESLLAEFEAVLV
jgi:hypothetical protein